MNSNSYDVLCQKIRKMPDWKAAALCAASADKVTPIVVGLGLPSTLRLVEKCLEFVWASVVHSVAHEEGTRLTSLLESTPEWECDDPSYLPFAVTKALDFVRFALWAATSVSANEQAERALSLLLEVAESFDTSITQFPDDRTVKSLGVQLHRSEQSSQDRLVGTIESASVPSADLVATLRQEAKGIAELFGKTLPIYCYYYVQG